MCVCEGCLGSRGVDSSCTDPIYGEGISQVPLKRLTSLVWGTGALRGTLGGTSADQSGVRAMKRRLCFPERGAMKIDKALCYL